MKTRILTQSDVYALLTMNDCVPVMTDVLKTLARGDAAQPLRNVMRLPDGRGLLGMMPAYLGAPRSIGVKVITVIPGNHGTEFDAHQGAILLFEADHGCLLSVMDASSVTAIRTAAISGVATDLLARKDATKVAILGSGVQAGTHLAAMREVREIQHVSVWSCSGANALAFATRESRRHEIAVEAVADAREAVTDADIICTTTSAHEPVLSGAWIRSGTHINAVGACLPTCRELDTEAVRRSRFYMDRRESVQNESGDYLIPLEEGAITEDHLVGEIGDVLLDQCPGRRTRDEVTLFKSLGLAVEDLAAAYHVYEKAKVQNVGVEIEFGGWREETDG